MKVAFIICILINFAAFTGYAQTLKEAIAKQDTILAAKLINEGADPNAKDANGSTLLMEACHFPNLPVAVFLLNHGATVNQPRSAKGRTALMVACAYWCGMDMVKLLVQYGADVNVQSLDGTTSLMLAASSEKLDVVIYLLEHGADANKKNAAGKTALNFATDGKAEDYMIKSIKDTRFDKEKVIESLIAATKNN
jgi:ankyrin repeat protein